MVLLQQSASLSRCVPCRHRAYSTIAPGQVPSPRASIVPGRSVLKVQGKDAPLFLNGLAAVKIPETFEGRPFYGAFLHAQGRILHDTFIYPHPPTKSFLIDYPTPSVLSPPLRDHLRKFVLRSKVGIKDVSDQYDVWAAWGHPDKLELELGGKRKWKFGNGETAELNWEPEPLRWEVSEGEVGGWDSRAPGMGWRGLVAKGDRPSVLSPSQSTTDDYFLHRLERGIAEGPQDLVPMSSLPSESNLDYTGGVDFRKGCYVGQELTVRTYHKGQTRKRIVSVNLYPLDASSSPSSPPPVLPPGSNIQLSYLPTPTSSSDSSTTTPENSPASRRPTRPKASGRLLSNVDGRGLALLRLEQVETVLRGDGIMAVKVEVEEGSQGEQPASEPVWGVRPRMVEWWPVKPSPSPPVESS